MSVNSDFVTHLNASRFMAQRAIDAETVTITPPLMVALPGALAPIHRDRLAAHQDDGLDMHQIVEYENTQFLKANARVRERHAQWVNRDYDAMVQAHQALEAERFRQEMEAAAVYRRKVDEILARKDTDAEHS